MKGKRWGWISLAVVVVATGICVFYFMSNTKSEQWIGVADSEPPNAEAQNAAIRVADAGEPAPPATRGEDVDLTKTESGPEISGEMTIGMAVAEGGSSRPSRVNAKVGVDPAILDAIGETLWTMLRPIDGPLARIDAPKSDMLSQLLLGNQPPIQEMKLSNPSVHSPRKIVAQDQQRLSNQDGRLQDLITQTQTIRDASPSGITMRPGALQTLDSPTQLGLTGSALRGGDPFAKAPLSSPLPIGR